MKKNGTRKQQASRRGTQPSDQVRSMGFLSMDGPARWWRKDGGGRSVHLWGTWLSSEVSNSTCISARTSGIELLLLLSDNRGNSYVYHCCNWSHTSRNRKDQRGESAVLNFSRSFISCYFLLFHSVNGIELVRCWSDSAPWGWKLGHQEMYIVYWVPKFLSNNIKMGSIFSVHSFVPQLLIWQWLQGCLCHYFVADLCEELCCEGTQLIMSN